MTDSKNELLEIECVSCIFKDNIKACYEPACGFYCSKCGINKEEPYCIHMKYLQNSTQIASKEPQLFTYLGGSGPRRDLTITEFQWLFFKLGLMKKISDSINIYQIVTCTILINRRTGTIELKVKLKEDIPLYLELTYNNNKIDIESLLTKVDTKRNVYLEKKNPQYEIDIELKELLVHKPIMAPGYECYLSSCGSNMNFSFFPRQVGFTIKKIISPDKRFLKSNEKGRVLIEFKEPFNLDSSLTGFAIFDDGILIGSGRVVQKDEIAILEPSPLNIKIYQEEKGKYKDELIYKYTVRSREEALKLDKEYNVKAGITDPSTASLTVFEGSDMKYSNDDVSLEQFLDFQSYLNLNERIIVSSLTGARARLNVKSHTFCIDAGTDTIRTFFLSSDFKLDYDKLPVRA